MANDVDCLAVVVVMSLVLWGVDSLFGWMISAVIG
jgi:preprotein translocase subunit SecE